MSAQTLAGVSEPAGGVEKVDGEATGSAPPALIPLRNRAGETVAYAIVDADDLERVSRWRWSLDYRGYAIRGTKLPGGKQQTVRMHRQVLNAVGDPRDVDHINRNKLDNRKANLRLCTRAENLANRSPVGEANPRSGIRGVRWDRLQQRWEAKSNGRRIGSYRTLDEAAQAIHEHRMREAS